MKDRTYTIREFLSHYGTMFCVELRCGSKVYAEKTPRVNVEEGAELRKWMRERVIERMEADEK